jgi:PAS domain S-box-containing protein
VPLAASAIVATVGVSVLVGWAVGSRDLTSVVPSLPTMKVNTALAFVVSALILRLRQDPTPVRRHVALAMAGALAVFGLVTLVEWVGGRSLGIDQLLFHDSSRSAGRPSQLTAIAFLLVGLTLLTTDARHAALRRVHFLTGCLFALTALVAAVGYVYGSQVLTVSGNVSAMAVTTMCGLVVLLAGVTAQQLDRPPASLLRGPGPGAVLLRRVVPSVLILTPMIGLLRLLGQDAGWYDLQFGLALFTVSMTVGFVVLSVIVAGALDRHDRGRRLAAQATHASELRFRALATMAPVGIFETTDDNRIIYANRRICEISGRSAAELERGLLATMYPDDRQRISATWSTDAAQNGEVETEFRLQRPDRTDALVLARRAPIRDRDGRVTGFLGMLDDTTTLRHAERIAREHEARLQALLDHVPMPMRLRDLDGRRLVINRACTELIEGRVEEALRPEPSAPYRSHTAPPLDEQERQVRAGGGSNTVEMSAHDVAGRRHDYLATKFPIADSEGQTVAVGGLWLDITERKQAEQTLHAAKERYRELFEDSPAGIIETTVDGTPVGVNRAWASLLGYDSPVQFMAEVASSTEIYANPADRETMAQAINEHEGNLGFELRMRRRDGTLVWVAFEGRAIRNKDAGTVGWQGSAVDITERKRVEAALSESEERFRLLAENSRDVIRLYDVDWIVRYASPSCEAVLGYPPEELVGHHASEFQHPDEAAKRGESRRRLLLTDHEMTVTYRSCRKDGTYVWLEMSVRALHDEHSGALTGYQEACRDITARKRIEDELRATNVALELASRAKDRFLSSMSHELRTPLNAILGFTGTLLMGLHGPISADQTTQLRTVQRTGKHLLALINGLLDLARIESGELEVHLEPVDCQDLLGEIVGCLRPLADEKGLALELLSGEQPVMVICDRRTLWQVLMNLGNNAIKFTDEGSVRFELGRRADGDRRVTRFAITDTGCGIAHEDQARLFLAFEQIPSADGPPSEGTGLGLHISQTLAAVIGGEITVESVPGGGSTFGLEFAEVGPAAGGGVSLPVR